MNEWLLIIFSAIALVVPHFLSRTKPPVRAYIRLAAVVVLMVLVWGFSDPGTLGSKLVLTAIAIGSLIQAVKEYRKPLSASR